MLFISHDLSVVRYIADRVVVMYLGHIVEQGTTDQIFAPPYHPYTEALLSAIPIADTSVVKKAHRAGGRHPVGDEPAARLPVPDALPLASTRCRAICAKPWCRRCKKLWPWSLLAHAILTTKCWRR